MEETKKPRRRNKRSSHKNYFYDLDPTLTTDEFICKNKQAIIKNGRLMELFFFQYRPYLYKCARRLMKIHPSLELDALVNEGFEGMLRALKKYNNEYASFLTYAQHWVNMKMNTYAYKAVLTISIPGSIHSALAKCKSLMQNNPGITNEELCAELDITEKKLKILQQAASLHVNSKGIDEQTGIAPYEELDDPGSHPDLEDSVFTKVMAEDLARILQEVLPTKECYVVVSLFGLNDGSPKVLERVGKVLNVSKERVRQIKEFAFERLRESGALHEFR